MTSVSTPVTSVSIGASSSFLLGSPPEAGGATPEQAYFFGGWLSITEPADAPRPASPAEFGPQDQLCDGDAPLNNVGNSSGWMRMPMPNHSHRLPIHSILSALNAWKTEISGAKCKLGIRPLSMARSQQLN
jgi:hypothetical protein